MKESTTIIRIENRKVTDRILYEANNQKWHSQLLELCVFTTFSVFVRDCLEVPWKSTPIGVLLQIGHITLVIFILFYFIF
jgi:hypothetical protein